MWHVGEVAWYIAKEYLTSRTRFDQISEYQTLINTSQNSTRKIAIQLDIDSASHIRLSFRRLGNSRRAHRCWLIERKVSNILHFSPRLHPDRTFWISPGPQMISEDGVIMSLQTLPTELLLVIFECVKTVTGNEGNPVPRRNATQRTVGRIFRQTRPSSNAEAPLSGEALRAFKNLRLTSRRLGTFATREVFRCVSLSENLESWLNVASLVAHPKLAWNVEVLTLSMPQLCATNCKDGNRIKMKSKSRIPQHYPAHLDLSFFPFLKSIQCLKWKLVKVGAIELPSKGFVIRPSLRMRNRSYLWNTASALSDITSFGWEFQYLHLSLLDQTKTWRKHIKTLRIGRLQTLDIDFRTHFKGWIGAHILETILPMIEDLPCLRTFKLRQFYSGEDPTVHQDLAANVFQLLENHNWPKIRQLEVSRPITRQEDFLTFLLRHKHTLQHLHYSVPERGGALSEWMNEDDLERWIERNIGPTESWVRYWFEAAYQGAVWKWETYAKKFIPRYKFGLFLLLFCCGFFFVFCWL